MTDWKNNRPDYDGGHYSIFYLPNSPSGGMAALREFFPSGEANDLNLVLFSTSGVHGSYSTIEDAERALNGEWDDPESEGYVPEVTFLVVQPRVVTLRYGNCQPENAEDIAFLKTLRQTSMAAVATIGQP